MLVTIKIEYENESISVALYEGIEVEELTNVITSSFHVAGSIIGLRDTNGVIFLPRFVCRNIPDIQQTTYELLVKGQKSSRPNAIPKRSEPIQQVVVKEDNGLVDILKYLKMDGFINRTEEKNLLEMLDKSDSELVRILNNYKTNGNFQSLKESLKQLSGKSQPQIRWQENIRPRTDAGYRSRRPLSAARLTENANINSTQAMLIGAVHELEKTNLLDEQAVCIIKTLILEENPEVLKLLNGYIAHIIPEREVCSRLQRLSERMSTYIERPSSPLPRKSSLLEFVNTIISTYIRDADDVELLQKLIEYENEFVLSAFDVFESDQDQENLLDTLIRILEKFKRMGINKDSVTAAGFYDGGILQPEIPRPTETRGRARRSRAQPFALEIDNGPTGEFPLNEGTSGPEEEAEEVNLPDAGLVYVTRGKKVKEEVKRKAERFNPTFKDFKETGAIDRMESELIGILKWGLNHEDSALKGAYNTWKVTKDNKLFQNIIESICTKLLETALNENLTSEQIQLYQTSKENKDVEVINLIEDLRKTGKLTEFIEELKEVINEAKEAGDNNEPVDENKNEEENDELVVDILSALETDGKISKNDCKVLNEMYKKGDGDVHNALQKFKQDHDFELLGDNLSKLINSKQRQRKTRSAIDKTLNVPQLNYYPMPIVNNNQVSNNSAQNYRLPPEDAAHEESIEVEEKNESEQEEDAQEANNDSGGDYDRVKEHMHMVLARYAKEGIIDYKEAAQIHDVIVIFLL